MQSLNVWCIGRDYENQTNANKGENFGYVVIS